MAPPGAAVTTLGRNVPAVKSSHDSQKLSEAATAQFQTLMKFYEDKDYKRAIKVANDILKKHPDHGETLSMKAMILSYTPNGRTAEVLDIAKQGLRANLTSSTCWHILGLLYRGDKNFNEAMRCFRQAYRLSPENMLLLRDLATLQVQERDLSGFLETRKKIFFQRPNLRLHWVAYAVANHLAGNYLLATHLIRTASRHFKSHKDRYGSVTPERNLTFEDGELYLYEAMLLEEAGSYTDALRCLESRPNAPDQIGRLEMLGRLYIYTRDYQRAHATFMELFRRCRANRRYFFCALATHPLFVDRVGFPVPPYQNGVPPTQDPVTSTDFLFYLSPYALRSPQLTTVDSPGWPLHPAHLLFANTYSSPPPLPTPSPSVSSRTFLTDVLLLQVRPITEAEESALTTWLFTDIFLPDKGNTNDCALRAALDLIESRTRFLYFCDRLLRFKVLKGVPFAANLIKGLCRHELKRTYLKELFERYIAGTRAALREPVKDSLCCSSILGAYSPQPPEIDGQPSLQRCLECEREETYRPIAPACFVTALVCYAVYLDTVGNHTEALDAVNEAIAHTPSLIELYLVKAQILKHLGAVDDAAKAALQGRDMDLADRFLNTECLKYCLASKDFGKADELAVYFSTDHKKENLTEMQCMRYELMYGKARVERGDKALGLKYFYDVLKHFKDMRLDQFDFHLYALHQGTLRAYIQFLRMQDRIEAHKYFCQAVAHIIPLLLEQADTQRTAQAKESLEAKQADQGIPGNKALSVCANGAVDGGTASLSGKKKKKKSEKKQAEQTKQEPITDEQEGQRLLEADGDPCGEAWQLALKLRDAAPLDIKTHQLVYQVAFRQEKPLILCQSLYRLWVLVAKDSSHPAFSPLLCHFLVHAIPLYAAHNAAVGSDKGNSGQQAPSWETTCSDTIKQGMHFVLEECLLRSLSDPVVTPETLSAAISGQIPLKDVVNAFVNRVVETSEKYSDSVPYLEAAIQCCTTAEHLRLSVSDVDDLDAWVLRRLKTMQTSSSVNLKDCLYLYRMFPVTRHALKNDVQTIFSQMFPRATEFTKCQSP